MQRIGGNPSRRTLEAWRYAASIAEAEQRCMAGETHGSARKVLSDANTVAPTAQPAILETPEPNRGLESATIASSPARVCAHKGHRARDPLEIGPLTGSSPRGAKQRMNVRWIRALYRIL